MLTNHYFIQAIGFLGTACAIGSFQCRSNRRLFILMTASNCFFLLQYWLLGALSGCFSLVLASLRNLLLSLDRPWVKRRFWPWLFSAAFITCAVVTWKDWFSVFPALAACGLSFGGWTFNPRKVRLAGLCCDSPGWLIYNWHVGSWGGVISEVFTICSVLVSILRFGWKALDEEQL